MAVEGISFSYMFDTSSTVLSELEDLYSRHFPLQLFTDSKSLFNVEGIGNLRKRLMLDVTAAGEGFLECLISDIGFLRSDRNLADGLTKTVSQASLQRSITTATLHTQPEQWILWD